MSDEKSSDWGRKFFGFILRHLVSILCLGALGFCSYQAFVLHNSPMLYKGAAIGIIGFWLVLILIKNFFKLLLVLLLVAAAAYGWFWFTGRDKAECEAKGGFWNKNTLTCEKKMSFMDQLKKTFKIDISSDSAK